MGRTDNSPEVKSDIKIPQETRILLHFSIKINNYAMTDLTCLLRLKVHIIGVYDTLYVL